MTRSEVAIYLPLTSWLKSLIEHIPITGPMNHSRCVQRQTLSQLESKDTPEALVRFCTFNGSSASWMMRLFLNSWKHVGQIICFFHVDLPFLTQALPSAASVSLLMLFLLPPRKLFPPCPCTHPVRELNVTSSGKFSLIHPGSYLLHTLYLNVVEMFNALMISLLGFPS